MFRKNESLIVLPAKNSCRGLRGSRLGRGLGLDKTEAKFRELLKNLKQHEKQTIFNVNDLPETSVKTHSIKKQIDSSVTAVGDIPQDDLKMRLEGKITPLRKLYYVRQLERKYNKSLSLLRMFGEKLQFHKVPITLGTDKLPCPVDLMMPSPFTEAYRNQDECSVGVGIDGNPKTVGFYLENLADNSNFVCVEPDELVILKDSHKQFIKDFQNYIRQSNLSAFSKCDKSGYWQTVSVRSNQAGDLMGIIAMHPQNFSEEEIHQERIKIKEYFESCKKNYNLKSLYFQSRSAASDPPHDLLHGDSCIVEELSGLKFQISPDSFFLTNTAAAEMMYSSIRKLCRVNDSTTVLDIFCGTGPISLLFSSHVKKCIGLDTTKEAITIAESNAVMNNIHNVEFLHGNIESTLKDIFNRDYHRDVIAIINPAKMELTKTAIRVLRECKYLKKIIYISTKPKTAVNNYVKLCRPCGPEHALGKFFVPLLALPVDLYPHTDHYGLIVMFQRL